MYKKLKKYFNKTKIRQYGSNCGIYSLALSINIHLYKNEQNNPLSKSKLRDFIAELTEVAVKKDDNNFRYSIVGEFYDMETYINFLNSSEVQKIISKYFPQLNVRASLYDKNTFFAKDTNLENNESYIFPYATKNNTHIIPIIEKSNNDKWFFINEGKLFDDYLDTNLKSNFNARRYRWKRSFALPFLQPYSTITFFLYLFFLGLFIKFYSHHPDLTVLQYLKLYSLFFTPYLILFFLINILKFAWHKELEIELKNRKDLKDIDSINLTKLIKLTYTEE